MTDFYQLASKRHSCRTYEEKTVEKEKILKCLEAARMAPSGCNSQPWRFVVVTNPEMLQKLSKLTQLCGVNHFTEHAPVLITVCEEEEPRLLPKIQEMFGNHVYAHGDLGISTAYLTLEAANQGLGSCIIGVFDEDKVKELLSIPKGQKLRMMVALGYPKEQKMPRKIRKPMEEIARFIE